MSKERLKEMKRSISRAERFRENLDTGEAFNTFEMMLLRGDLYWLVEQAERVQELEEDYEYLSHYYGLETEQNKRYREAREIIEQIYKDSYVINTYGYEDGYLDGLDTAMNVIDEALEESE